MTLNEIFNEKVTENGDISFSKVSDNVMLNILFLTEYYQKHLSELPNLGNSNLEQLFSMFIRDPRFGLGRRDLGRVLMMNTQCSIEQILKAGRVDDLFCLPECFLVWDYFKKEIENGNELVKKWMPRYSSKNLMLARKIAKYWGMNKQQYGKFIKCNTVEQNLSRKETDKIKFEHVPSLAMLKYANRFATGSDTKDRYDKYLEDVKSGKKDLKVSTTTVYDVYKNMENIDADVFFDKLEKIKVNCIPVVDTSGSMWDSNDSMGKALSVGHYLAKCSTYCPNKVVSFSSRPQLSTLGVTPPKLTCCSHKAESWWESESQYKKEIASMYTGDCSNTDLGAVMDLLSKLDGDMPEYLVVLSDMEFDYGSKMSKDATMKLFKKKGYKTRIIWWNFNSRNVTCPEMDSDGNIFLSGYNPMLLKYLEAGFNGEEFLRILLNNYAKALLG